jgi:hypothetical protein
VNELDKLIALRELGLCTEGLGPAKEWEPVSQDEHYQRHNKYWKAIGPLLTDAYGDNPEADDTDLPEWMSERATNALKANDPIR